MNIATNGFVFDQYGNILLIQRDDTRTFAPPGGALDAGELPTDGCAREVREETGLIVYPVRLVGIYFQDIFDGGMLLLSFRCIQRGGKITPSPESPLVAWFKASKLPSPMLSFHRDRTKQALAHDGGPPIWERYNWSLTQKFGRFLLTNIVYRWKDWQRKRRGEPLFQPAPAWQTGAFTVIRNDAGQALWIKRTDKDVWNLPGGGSELNEAPWETAVRETREETGLQVRLTDLSSVNVYHDQPNMTFNFTAEITGGTLTTGPEAADFAWFTPGDEPANCVQQHVERVADAVGPSAETIFRHQPGPEAVYAHEAK